MRNTRERNKINEPRPRYVSVHVLPIVIAIKWNVVLATENAAASRNVSVRIWQYNVHTAIDVHYTVYLRITRLLRRTRGYNGMTINPLSMGGGPRGGRHDDANSYYFGRVRAPTAAAELRAIFNDERAPWSRYSPPLPPPSAWNPRGLR